MPPTRLPRPWLAGLLNIFLPGLGLFYAGQQRRAWIGMAAFAVLAVVFTALQLIRPVPATVVCMFAVAAVILVVRLSAIVMAYGAARQARAEGRARAPWTPVLLLLAASITLSDVVRMLPSWVGHAFYNHDIPSGSMAPGLPVGTRLYTSQGPVVERGRIVFYHPRGADGATFVKRIVGLAGDRVRLTQGRLFVNGQAAAPSDPASEVLDGHRYPITPPPVLGLGDA